MYIHYAWLAVSMLLVFAGLTWAASAGRDVGI